MIDIAAEFGGIDIYLFDQLQRGRIRPGHRIFDAGCGGGRNLVHLLRRGYDLSGVDTSAEAIAAVRALAAQVAPDLPPERFRAEPIEENSFPDAWADVVIANAVLHFARDDAHFRAMLEGAWRLLRPGGIFFARLASRSGIESEVRPLGQGRYLLPDGSERFLVDEPMLASLAAARGGVLADPLKTTLVHGARSMTTWVLRRAT